MTEPRRIIVTVPDEALLPALDGIDGFEAMVWDLVGAAPAARIDMIVGPPGRPPRPFREALDGVGVGLLQLYSIGYEAVVGTLPAGIAVANSASVHEPATAELALTLLLAMQSELPDLVRAQDRGEWLHRRRAGLIDRRVMLLGYGGIGLVLEHMLAPFGADLVRVASRPRLTDDGARVYGVDELPALLPTVDVVIVAVPLSGSTEGLVDRPFLSRLPNGALVVNVSRGRIADTDAIVAEASAGRLRFALDTTEPEPLPADHALWSLPGVLISPHLGGISDSVPSRMRRLIREQAERLARGEAPRNVVFVSE